MRIYFDMDGVLSDFVGGVLNLYSASANISDVRRDMWVDLGFSSESEFWRSLSILGGFPFWAGLKRLADGVDLLNRVESYINTYSYDYSNTRISILSTPAKTYGCCDGKQDWITRNLPYYEGRLFLGEDKSVHAGPDAILIDDKDENIEKFEFAGGYRLLIPRPWNSHRNECDSEGNFDVDRVFNDFIDTMRIANLD